MNIEIALTTRLKGRYKIEAVDSKGRKRLLADWFENLILNNGLDMLGTAATEFAYCSVGTGNTAPASTQTALVTWLASSSTVLSHTNTNNNTGGGTPQYYGQTTITWNFAAGVATGTLAEVGVGASNTGTNLFSRALILDSSGNPTTITVLSTESLQVTYQLQSWAPTADVTGSQTVNGTSYAYTFRGSFVGSNGYGWSGLNYTGDYSNLAAVVVYNGAIGAATAGPAGSTAGFGSIAAQSYTSGNYYRNFVVSWGAGDGNLTGGISAISMSFGNVSSMGTFQVGFSPALPKSSSNTMTLTFRHNWAVH